jgi:hypothetical protein
VNIVGSPAASTQRVVDFISIFNRDTVNATVTIKLDANGTEYILFKCTLAAGETLVYQEGVGFFVLANSGAVKQSINQGNNTIGTSLTAVVLGADVINNNPVANSIADVTGLSFPVNSGSVYRFSFEILYSSAATTTGSRWSVNGPAFTYLCYMSEYSLAATTTTRNANLLAYDSPAACNASSGSTTSNKAIVAGMIRTNASGTIIARFASEIASSAITARAGSVCYYQQLI